MTKLPPVPQDILDAMDTFPKEKMDEIDFYLMQKLGTEMASYRSEEEYNRKFPKFFRKQAQERIRMVRRAMKDLRGAAK